MIERYALATVKHENEIIRFTLVINDPLSYFVEQCHEPTKPFVQAQKFQIKPDELSKRRVNGIPLIKLVERKLEELAEAADYKSAA